jgi:peptidoglycan/LPS O-acetylase OafA/YrhL
MLPFYVFLTANVPFILQNTIRFLTHYWSLGVEEQFYAWWPWVVKKSKNVFQASLIFFCILFLAKIVARILDIRLNHGNVGYFYEALHETKFDCMLIGALGAILYFRKDTLFMKLTDNYPAQIISWSVLMLVATNKFQTLSVMNHEVISLVTLTIIIGQIGIRKRIINLENRFMDFIGKISYGIYIYHVLIIFYLSRFLHATSRDSAGWYLLIFLSVMIISVVVSYFSYHYFEKKFLQLKQKFTVIQNQAV